MQWQNYFKGKKITVMGLGLLGRGVGDAAFLAKAGAELIITDLKTKEQLASSLEMLKEFKNITYVLGEHRLEDFRDRDFILKAAGVPLDSPYITEARKNNIPIEMSASLFAKLSGATIIGITGTRGKSTVTHMLYDVLQKAYKGSEQKILLGGNVRGVSTLSLLEHATQKDIAVVELDSWQLQGFGDSKLSPHISIFTTFFPDHMNYYKDSMDLYLEDKAQIFKYQTSKDFLILGEQVAPRIESIYGSQIQSTLVKVGSNDVPADWHIQMPGEHNRYNAALVIAVARILEVDETILKSAVEQFEGVPGRLQLVKKYNGIHIYNDTTSTTPIATVTALQAFGDEKKNILIMGGADKDLDMSELLATIPVHCKAVMVLPGTGTDRIKKDIQELSQKLKVEFVTTLEVALSTALSVAEKGDNVLFSPGFASFGLFKNEFDRGDQFNALVEKIG